MEEIVCNHHQHQLYRRLSATLKIIQETWIVVMCRASLYLLMVFPVIVTLLMFEEHVVSTSQKYNKHT